MTLNMASCYATFVKEVNPAAYGNYARTYYKRVKPWGRLPDLAVDDHHHFPLQNRQSDPGCCGQKTICALNTNN